MSAESQDELVTRVRQNVPAELRDPPVWLLWKYRPDKKGGKPKKVPYYSDGSTRGTTDTPEDRGRLVTFERAAEAFAAGAYAGLGIALGEVPDTGKTLSGIDNDKVVTNGEIDSRVRQIIDAGNSYAEVSPSGTGTHVLGYGKIGTVKKDAHGLEIYDHGRFFTVSGRSLNGANVGDITTAAQLARNLFQTPTASPVVEGSRNNALYAYARGLRAQNVDDGAAWAAMQARNATYEPPMDETEVRQIFDNAWKHEPGPQLSEPGALHEMNARRAVVNWKGRTLILTELRDPNFNRMCFELSSPGDLKSWCSNKFVAVEGPKGVMHMNLGAWWLAHPERREYQGVVFAPRKTVPGFYNLWIGFAVEPSPGDCSLWMQMVRDVICSGDEALYRYVIAWCADAVQNPTERPGVVLVLIGKQGKGKGTFACGVGELFGEHFLPLRHSRHLVGNFNAHLANVLLLFADEAFYAGDKQHEGALKGLITEPTIPIEYKGKDVVNVQNHLRIIMGSNQSWVVPAAMDDRRFCVIEVSNAQAQQHDYFQKIKDQLKNGGSAALLDHLLKYDLTGIDLRKIPDTKARFEQQVQTMGPFAAFWFDRLSGDEASWETSITTGQLWKEYKETAGKYPGTDSTFGMRIKKLFPKSQKVRARTRPSHPGGHSRRVRIYQLPEFNDARVAFEAHFGRVGEWPVVPDSDEEVIDDRM